MVQDERGEWVYRDAPKNETKGDKETEEKEEVNELDDMEMMPPIFYEGMSTQYNYSNLVRQSKTWDSLPN